MTFHSSRHNIITQIYLFIIYSYKAPNPCRIIFAVKPIIIAASSGLFTDTSCTWFRERTTTKRKKTPLCDIQHPSSQKNQLTKRIDLCIVHDDPIFIFRSDRRQPSERRMRGQVRNVAIQPEFNGGMG